MAFFKVKIQQGAFINDTLYREDEVVELPEGQDPNWGVRCTADGQELESMSEKVLNRSKMNEHLAKAIEGKDTSKITQELAKENAELKVTVANMSEQLAKLTELITAQQGAAAPDGGENPPKPGLDEASAKQVDETVKMLEDSNNDHWTARGEPRLDLIKEMTGLDVSRADVDAVNDRRREKQPA